MGTSTKSTTHRAWEALLARARDRGITTTLSTSQVARERMSQRRDAVLIPGDRHSTYFCGALATATRASSEDMIPNFLERERQPNYDNKQGGLKTSRSDYDQLRPCCGTTDYWLRSGMAFKSGTVSATPSAETDAPAAAAPASSSGSGDDGGAGIMFYVIVGGAVIAAIMVVGGVVVFVIKKEHTASRSLSEREQHFTSVPSTEVQGQGTRPIYGANRGQP